VAKAKNTLEAMAAKAAERLDKARAAGEQLALLPDEPGRTPQEAGSGSGKGGRPKGALGKGSSQMREWLAAKGLRMPEDQLADMAGLASSESAMLTAMAKAEQVLAWSFDGATDADGKPRVPAPEQRLAMFQQVYATQLRAAEALLPYGTPKASPDVKVEQAVTFVMPGAATDPGAQARDITPKSAPGAHRMMPADVRHEMKQKQALSESEIAKSDSESRTDAEND
jgi:hypothetical protein